MQSQDKSKGVALRQCAESRYQPRAQRMLPGSGSSCSSSCSCIGGLSDVLTVPI